MPVGWLAVRVNEQEYRDALIISADIHKYFSSIQNNDPNIFRLFAIDTQEGHFQDGFFTNMNFIWDAQNAAIPNDDGLKTGVAQLTDIALEPETPSITFSATSTSNGLSIALIESKSTMMNSSAKNIVVFQKQVVFNAKTGTVAITVSTVEELKETIFAAFDAMLETIKITP